MLLLLITLSHHESLPKTTLSVTCAARCVIHFRMNLADTLDLNGEVFDTVTHGGLQLLKAALNIFKQMTKNQD